MHWYLVQTKPRQEQCALDNLQRQGYECYLPTLRAEKIRQGAVAVVAEPLFPRYLFIRLSQENSAPSWAPIRSTKGVTRLVSFGVEPAKGLNRAPRNGIVGGVPVGLAADLRAKVEGCAGVDAQGKRL